MRILNSENYPFLMYVLMIVVSLLIFFSLLNEFQIYKPNVYKYDSMNPITGWDVYDKNGNNSRSENPMNKPKGNLYSEKSYFLYTFIIIFLSTIIFLISVIIFFKRFRDYT